MFISSGLLVSAIPFISTTTFKSALSLLITAIALLTLVLILSQIPFKNLGALVCDPFITRMIKALFTSRAFVFEIPNPTMSSCAAASVVADLVSELCWFSFPSNRGYAAKVI